MVPASQERKPLTSVDGALFRGLNTTSTLRAEGLATPNPQVVVRTVEKGRQACRRPSARPVRKLVVTCTSCAYPSCAYPSSLSEMIARNTAIRRPSTSSRPMIGSSPYRSPARGSQASAPPATGSQRSAGIRAPGSRAWCTTHSVSSPIEGPGTQFASTPKPSNPAGAFGSHLMGMAGGATAPPAPAPFDPPPTRPPAPAEPLLSTPLSVARPQPASNRATSTICDDATTPPRVAPGSRHLRSCTSQAPQIAPRAAFRNAPCPSARREPRAPSPPSRARPTRAPARPQPPLA